MAEFRRQPEWQQHADRHSQLIDPVLTVRPISRFDYTARRPVTAIDHALVFATAAGVYDVYIPPHRPTRTDAATRRYVSVYEVDMGSHPVQLELELPSDDDAFSFGVTADLTWRVADPIAYVRSGERNLPARLTRELHQCARPVSRRFSIEDSPAAEEAVQQTVEAGVFAAGIGVAVTCMLRLRLDDEAVAHRRRRRSLRYEHEMLAPEHQYHLQQARQQHELEVLRQQQEQELTARKIEFYRYHLQHNGVGAWALHLAEHPEDTQLVMSSIRKDQLSLIQSQLELISGDGLEDYQKAESAKFALHAVNELIHQQGLAPAGPPTDAEAEPAALPQQPGAYTEQPYAPPAPEGAPPGPAATYAAWAPPQAGPPAEGGPGTPASDPRTPPHDPTPA
ncbi:PE-PGRS family protein [Streptomyces sp. NPDC054871]